jgi:chemotaxis protein methyltransferase CheR
VTIDPGVDLLLAQMLRSELGYVPDRWPEALYQLVRKWADANASSATEALRRVSQSGDQARLHDLVDAATIGFTTFFRHPEQFEHLRRVLVAIASPSRPVDVWCAGCATGEEAYSVALAAEEAGVSVRVLGTDVSPAAIRAARRGRFAARRTGALPGGVQIWDAPEPLKKAVRFEVASLVGGAPAAGLGPFDLIFCRNVLIYFDRQHVKSILSRLRAHLRPEGAIVVAPGDGVLPIPEDLVRGPAIGWLHPAAGGTRMPAPSAPGLLPASLPQNPPRAGHPHAPPAVSTPRPAPPAAPRAEATTLERASRLLGSGDLAQAETLLREILDSDLESPSAWFLLGETLLQRGERSQALVAFSRAARCAPRDDGIDADALKRAAARRAESLAKPRR